MKAKVFVAVFGGLELLMGLTGGGGVAHRPSGRHAGAYALMRATGGADAERRPSAP
ncbi:MAG: hypothetical protein U1E77_15200 [Inhella sp.]